MKGYLSDEVKITVLAAVATGTTTITQTTGIDQAGYDGTVFIVRLGSPSTTDNIRITQCDTTNGTYADLAGTLVGNNATDNPLIVDVRRTQKQYLKYVITRGTGTTIENVTVIQYGGRAKPASQPSGTQLEKWLSPSEGTA